MEKDIYLKVIFVCILMAMFPIAIFGKNKFFSQNVFQESQSANEKVSKIIEENKDMDLIAHKTYDEKFVYLAFQSESFVTSYIIDSKTGEEKNFDSYIKPEKKDAFFEKEKELLYLKYPNFIVDVLVEDSGKKTYQICENELVIHYYDVAIEPVLEEHLFLRVNYNEIKDFLDFTVSLDSDYENENGYLYDKNKKAIAFTFDDGPTGDKTNKIVEALNKNKAHATFFMVGNRMEYGKNVIMNVLNHGNEIGSHSYAHKNMAREKIDDLISEEEKTNEIYKSITGKDLIYTRPPYGAITKNVKESLNTIFITWNLDTEDWLHRNKNYIVDYVMENVSDGDIILMHDSYDSTVEAVEELLPKLYAAGYQVVSVSELANLKGKTLEMHSLYRSIKEN